jgi:hypothetical protein
MNYFSSCITYDLSINHNSLKQKSIQRYAIFQSRLNVLTLILRFSGSASSSSNELISKSLDLTRSSRFGCGDSGSL